MSDERPANVRLTPDVRRQLLEQNDGFTTNTHYEDKNFSEYRTYTILDGEVHIDSNTNTSWADSRQRSEHVADETETHRFLYNNLHSLDQDGIVPMASRPKEKVTPAADTSDSDAPGRKGAGASDNTDIGADTHDVSDADTDTDDESKDNDGLNAGLLIAITVVALAVTAAVTVAGVAVWKKTAKPALERRRAVRAEQNAADERAQAKDAQIPEAVAGDED